jgi:NitT/TauT family transport system substrate-binding protein
MRRVQTIALLCVLLVPALALAETFPKMRFSLPPVYEALPVAFAHEWGLFAEHGLEIELLGFSDLDERSAALHTGYLDGLMSEVTHALLNASTGLDLVITAAASSQPQTGSLALALVSPASFRVTDLQQLLASNHPVGVLRRSDHEYMLDRLIQTAAPNTRTATKISAFSDMLQLATMVGAQWLSSAVLPEPYIAYLTTYAPPGRAPVDLVLLSDFGDAPLPPTVVVFRRSFVEAYPDAVRAFHTAYNEAVRRLNAGAREEIIDTGLDVAVSLFFEAANVDLIGQDVLDAIPIPVFFPLGHLEESMYVDIARWMEEKRYLYGRLPSYADFFDGRLLP